MSVRVSIVQLPSLLSSAKILNPVKRAPFSPCGAKLMVTDFVVEVTLRGARGASGTEEQRVLVAGEETIPSPAMLEADILTQKFCCRRSMPLKLVQSRVYLDTDATSVASGVMGKAVPSWEA
jgi:hypothetical protein